MKPTYSDKDGKRYTTSQIDAKIRLAKGIKLDKQLQEHGYNFCETCKRNDCKPITCAHVISVKEAKESGNAQLCWDLNNIVLEGMPCHQKRDKLNIQFNDAN